MLTTRNVLILIVACVVLILVLFPLIVKTNIADVYSDPNLNPHQRATTPPSDYNQFHSPDYNEYTYPKQSEFEADRPEPPLTYTTDYTSSWIIIPKWNYPQIFATVYFILVMFLSMYSESGHGHPLGYGKFGRAAGTFHVPSRLGMAIVYAPAPILYLFDYFAYSDNPFRFSTYHLLIMFAFVAHFLKREFEVLFVHSYAGYMDIFAIPTITVSYSILSFLMAYHTNHLDVTMHTNSTLLVGFVIWMVGEIINGYHHMLLARLRKLPGSFAGGAQNYEIPKGGLFNWIACPHYLGEIISWFGIALMSRYLFAWLNFAAMTMYLTFRAQNTLNWYKTKFKETWPSERKAIIPFIW